MKIQQYMSWLYIALFLIIKPTFTYGALEDWQTHTSMNEVTSLARYGQRIYGTSTGGLFWYDEVDSFYVYYTNLDGLPGNDLTTAEKDGQDNLWIGTNGLGLVKFNTKDESFVTFHDFEGLRINALLSVGDSLLYVGMEEGVSLFLINDEEVKENYLQLSTQFEIRTEVMDVLIIDGKIFCTTPIGVAWANLSHPNLKDPTAWESVIIDWAPQNIIFFHNSEILLGGKDQGFFKLDIEEKRIIPLLSNENKEFIPRLRVHDFAAVRGTLYAATIDGIYRYSSPQWFKTAYLAEEILSLETAEDSLLILGSANRGIDYWSPDTGDLYIPFMHRPVNNTFVDITVDQNGVLWTASGYSIKTTMVSNPGLQRYQDNFWNWYSMEDNHFFTDDIITVEVDDRGRLWIGVWGGKTWGAEHGGAYVLIDDGTIPRQPDSLYAVDPAKPTDPIEEKILLPTLAPHYIVCPDIGISPTGEIWIANYIQESPPDQTYAYPPSGVVVVDDFPVTQYTRFFPHDEEIDGITVEGIATSQVGTLKIDVEGNVWIGGSRMGGLTFLMTNGTPFDKTDDSVEKFIMADGLLSNSISDIAIDQNGIVWIGSEGGINTVTHTGDQFDIASLNADTDLPSNEVNAITVDPYNNKWFGTKEGLAVMDGRSGTITVYTTKNSGLVHNNVLSLFYDEARDVLWVGTSAGISEFYAGQRSLSARQRVLAHPNPVIPGKGHNKVTFSYLGKNTTLSIYTSAGELVRELSPPDWPRWDGTRKIYIAEWNLANFSNNLVGSGIYFFVGTDENGRSLREKLAIIR